jgi:transcriptional regulator with XRE-family HTH domain
MPRPGPASLRALGAAIRKRRAEMGISQEELAHRAKLDRSYVGGVERGERNVAYVNILKLAGALDLSPPELMSRAEKD